MDPRKRSGYDGPSWRRFIKGMGSVLSDQPVDPDAMCLDIGSDVVMATQLATDAMAGCDPPEGNVPLMAWELVRNDVHYQAERGDQFIRLPWRTLLDGAGDCKSTATLIASVCAASGYNVVLRMICQPGEEHFGHVYAVVDGVAVDPLLEFGDECPYIAAQDVPIRPTPQ